MTQIQHMTRVGVLLVLFGVSLACSSPLASNVPPTSLMRSTARVQPRSPLPNTCSQCLDPIEVTRIEDFEKLGMCQAALGGLVINKTSFDSIPHMACLQTIRYFSILGGRNLTDLRGFGILGISETLRLLKTHDLMRMDNIVLQGDTFQNIFLEDNAKLRSSRVMGSEIRVVRAVVIARNAHLVDVDVLEGLQAVSERFYVHDNPELTDISGLRSLRAARELELVGNTSLTDLDALRRLRHVEMLHIALSPGLHSLSGLEGLQQIDSWLSIVKNPNLENLDALAGVESLYAATLTISHNPSLRSLAGIQKFIEVPRMIVIVDNPRLCPQQLEKILRHVPKTRREIRNNGSACVDQPSSSPAVSPRPSKH